MSFIVGALTAAGAFTTGAVTISQVAAGASIGSMVGSTLSNIFGAQTKSEERGQIAAAGDVHQQKLGFLAEEKSLAQQASTSQYIGGKKDLSMGIRTGLTDVESSADIARSKSDLVTSGTIEGKVKTQTGDLMAKYKSEMTKLFDTRQMQVAEANLRHETGVVSAEQAFEETKANIESQTPWYA